jgi:hypothetical protein
MSAEKLHQLLDDLRNSRGRARSERPEAFDARLASVTEALADVPLFHGTDQGHLQSIWDKGHLESRKTLGHIALDHQRCFDTYEAVYTSAGVMYPQRQVAFAFSRSIEQDAELQIDGSPWDTGAFFRHVAPLLRLDTDQAKSSVFHAHTLGAPWYRDYLVAYVATCFACAADYLRSGAYAQPDPAQVMSSRPNDFLLRVFEVRVRPRLPLESRCILALFLPSPRYLTPSIAEHLCPVIEGSGVRIEYYGRPPRHGVKTNPTPDDLRRYVTAWMCNRIQREAKP